VRSVATRRGPALLLVGVLALAGCTNGADDGSNEAGAGRAGPNAGGPSNSPSPHGPRSSPTPADPSPSDDPATLEEGTTPLSTNLRRANPVIERIPDRQWQHILEVGAWRPGCPAGRSELRRVNVNYVDFDGEVRRGALVVNRDVADSVARIFTRLFERRFPIRRMRPVESYGGDVNASLAADNTSAFNCRQLSQINAPVPESPHANGRAIDINPRENPWTDLRCDCWLPSPRNRAREPGPGKILRNGFVWRVFHREGWVWQDIDVPDYMHFDTGYPSRSYRGPAANKQMLQRQERREQKKAQQRS
jgi:hypothetical protein